MLKLPRFLIAGALVVTCLSASSQENSDYFGQSAEPEVGQQATQSAQPAPRRLSISNATEARREPRRDSMSEESPAPRRELDRDTTRDLRNTDFGDGAPRVAPVGSAAGQLPPALPLATEFQKFIFDSTGKKIPVFGADYFAKGPTTFAPLGNAPVPSEYILGPGDELLIRGWGSIDIDYRAKIDRNGLIAIPTIGSIVLAGIKAGDAEAVVRGAVGKLYKGVTINVNFGQLRAITVYVVGQASRPGTYTVSSLSTLVTAVFASGGPNANGSMRRIQVKRGGAVAGELDLYSFIAKGDKSGDIKLRDGDTIYIPRAIGHVALVGKVNTPAIYELRGTQDTVESLLEVAGGMPVVADPRRVFLERIDVTRSQPRSVEQFALNAAGLKRPLKNGDVLNLNSITPDFGNAVVLRGNVDQAIRAPYKDGMRVSDLIPNREYLITRNSVKRQNNVVVADEMIEGRNKEGDIAARIGGLIDEINWDYAVVERINRADLTVSLIPFNLGKMFANPAGRDNIALQPGDTVTIFSQRDVAVPMEKRRVFVRVEGEVNVPGVYQMTAGENLQTLLARAGGVTGNAYLFGTAFYRDQVRKEQEANLEKVAARLEVQLRNEQSRAAVNSRRLEDAGSALARQEAELASARGAIARLRTLKPTGRIAFNVDPRERSVSRLPQLKLENGDRLVIPAKVEFVHVFGAVDAEASPLWHPNGRVNDYIKLAGLSPDADRDNIFILRVDGSVVSRHTKSWNFGGFGGVEVMPGDSIVVPEKFDKESAWTKFTQGTREWAQIFASFGLGAAAIQTLRN